MNILLYKYNNIFIKKIQKKKIVNAYCDKINFKAKIK